MKKYSVLFLTAIFLVHLLSGCSVNPVSGKKEFTLLSVEKEIEMGKESYPVMTQMNNGEYISNGLKTYVNNIGQRLASVSHRKDVPYEFNVVNSSDINAYALPGGKISITRGMLSVIETEGQLAAVLGHEIGHVTARHASQAITRDMLLQTALTVGQVAMDVKDVKNRQYYAMAGNVAASLVGLKYSRNQESQSDELGLTYMISAGYNPEEFIKMLEILRGSQQREPYRIEALIQSHPLTRDRVAYAEDWVKRSRHENPGMDSMVKNTDEFEKWIKPLRDEREAYAHYDAAEELVNKEAYSAAVEEYQKSIQLKRNEALFHADLGWVYHKLDRKDMAESEYDKAIYYNPNLFKARYGAGDLFIDKGNYQRAITELRAAEGMLPNIPAVYYLQGKAYEKLNLTYKAQEAYQKTLELDPEGEYGQASRQRLDSM